MTADQAAPVGSTRGSTRSQRQQLRQAVTSIVDGTDRSDEIVRRLLDLLERADDVGFGAELSWVGSRYLERAASEDDLVLMAEQVLKELRAERRPEPRWRLAVPADARGLDRRWTDESGRERSLEVAARLRAGKPLTSAAFGEHEGRLDLRGFVSPMAELELLDTAKKLVLDGVDLSGARLGRIAFTGARISRSMLEGVHWSGGGLWSTTVEDTSFRGSDVSEGTLAGNVFRRVDFRGANLSGQGLTGARFEDCDFSNARLNGTEFHSDLIRCRFAGHLHGTHFYGRVRFGIFSKRLEDVDFSQADLHGAAFRGLDLESVRLPETPGHVIVRHLPCVLDRLGQMQREGRLPIELEIEAAELRAWRGRHQRIAVVSVTDLAEHATKEDHATALSILDEVQRACQGDRP